MKNTIAQKAKRCLQLIVLCVTVTAFSQKNKKTTLGLLTIEALNVENNYKEAAELTNTIKELFVESKKYYLLDRSQYAETAIFDELETQKKIGYINGIVAKQGKQNGALVLVGGKLTSVEYTKLKNGIQCLMTFTINITDVESNVVLATKVFKPNLVETKVRKADGIDQLTARTSRLLQLRNKINNFIIANTPFYAKIIELEKEGKNTNILLEVGDNEGVRKGDRFAVYQVKKYEGNKTREVEVTKFSISKVQGDFSIGKISKKDIENLQDLISNKDVHLICKQIECKICI
ncbi:MAG: hypothetical protein HRT65_00580 [Flavobacteriaceae bacterium]|nr:hypothetical protein [Flavobacteriaceae bacterium]